VCPGFFKALHFVGEFPWGKGSHAPPLKLLADLMILAEDAAEIASGEKDGARSTGTGDRGLLSEVQSDMGNGNAGTGPAEAGLPPEAVDTAFTRAAPAAERATR